MNKRWYDNNPKIRLLIKLIEEANEDTREYCINYIEEKAKECGLKPENEFDYIWQRSEDEIKDFKNTISYLKQFDSFIQDIVSDYLIKYVKSEK